MMKMKLKNSNEMMFSRASSRDKMKLSNISVTNWRLGVGKSRNSTSYSSKPRQHCQPQEKTAPGGRSCGEGVRLCPEQKAVQRIAEALTREQRPISGEIIFSSSKHFLCLTLGSSPELA